MNIKIIKAFALSVSLLSLFSCESNKTYTSKLYSLIDNNEVRFVYNMYENDQKENEIKYGYVELYSNSGTYEIKNTDGSIMNKSDIVTGMIFDLTHHYKGTQYVNPIRFDVESLIYTGEIIGNFNPEIFVTE